MVPVHEYEKKVVAPEPPGVGANKCVYYVCAKAGDPWVRRLADKARCRVRYYALESDDCGDASVVCRVLLSAETCRCLHPHCPDAVQWWGRNRAALAPLPSSIELLLQQGADGDAAAAAVVGGATVPRLWLSVRGAVATVADDGIRWTADAEARLQKIPGFVRGRVRGAAEKYARENGITTITDEVFVALKPKK